MPVGFTMDGFFFATYYSGLPESLGFLDGWGNQAATAMFSAARRPLSKGFQQLRDKRHADITEIDHPTWLWLKTKELKLHKF